ncbi:MAG: hypothetical protein AAF483_15820 [Planctomycetota bacterium]
MKVQQVLRHSQGRSPDDGPSSKMGIKASSPELGEWLLTYMNAAA